MLCNLPMKPLPAHEAGVKHEHRTSEGGVMPDAPAAWRYRRESRCLGCASIFGGRRHRLPLHRGVAAIGG